MATETLRKELSAHFGEYVLTEETLLSECITMCQMARISGQDLFYKWEAFSITTSGPRPLFTLEGARALKGQLQRDIATENSRRQLAQARANSALAQAAGRMKGRLVGQKVLGVPGSGRVSGGAQVVSGFGEHERKIAAGPSKVAFSRPRRGESSIKNHRYKYMYEKISERSEVLDERIDEFAELVKEYYHIPDLGDPSAATEADVTVVGRIVLDSDSSPSSSGSIKLNEASLALESSRMMGSGARVALRFEPQVKIQNALPGAGGVGLFPGAIVALRGRNGGGGWFAVTTILSLPPLKTAPRVNIKMEPEESGFSLFVACGPFTSETDLKYKPWHTLLETIKSSKPSVILLVGPFVDAHHPKIKAGDIDNAPAVIFRSQFLDSLGDALDGSPGSMALVVPSVRDIVSQRAVFPQGELPSGLSFDPRIQLLSNPCHFNINGVSFGVSSVDVLLHLRKEELFKRAEEVDPLPGAGGELPLDAMSKLCRHLLVQRSFYPIFPVPVDVAHEVNLDVSHSEDLKLSCESEDDAPDVLVLPSRLKHFSKVVDGTTVINPSFLSKGTYSTLAYAPAEQLRPVKDCLKVEISRIDIH